MRISVLGNSDTTGQRLQPGERPWTELVADRLREATGEPASLDSWKFAAYRPGAVDYALHLVDEAKPDIVIVTLASYWCAFSTVQLGVERRFGRRAAGWYRKIEGTVERRVERIGPATETRRRAGRRIARRILGTGTLLSVPGFIEVYSNLIRELSRREDMDVVVLGDHHFNAELREKMPNIEPAIERIERAIRPLVDSRHLRWGDLEAAISAGGRREEMILPDGVHMTSEAHERVTAMLVPLLAGLGVANRAPSRGGTP